MPAGLFTMPYNPFPAASAIQDLTVLHIGLLLEIYSLEPMPLDHGGIQPLRIIKNKQDLDATMDLMNLGLIRSLGGLFYKTEKGDYLRMQLYGKSTSL